MVPCKHSTIPNDNAPFLLTPGTYHVSLNRNSHSEEDTAGQADVGDTVQEGMEEDNELTDVVESYGDQVEIAQEEHRVRYTQAYQQTGEYILVRPSTNACYSYTSFADLPLSNISPVADDNEADTIGQHSQTSCHQCGKSTNVEIPFLQVEVE